jgi:YD repeat-containing protein
MRLVYPFYRILLFIIVLSFHSWIATCQNGTDGGNNTMQYNKSSSSSGNTSFLNAAASVSPSLYTGGLQVNLPLYTLKGIDLDVPISIAYTASNGVRATDPNTSVGMDWTLMAGGSISRTVRGLPDESVYGYIGPNTIGANVVNDFNNPTEQATQNLNNLYNLSLGNPVVDGEPDIYTISTPSFAMQFTFDQNGKPVFSGGNSGLQVIHSLYKNTGGATKGITVIDPQGTQYIFGTQAVNREMTTTTLFGTSVQFVSAWHLEKIISLNSKDVITFTYQTEPDETVYSYLLSKSYTANFPSSPWLPTGVPSTYTNVVALPIQRTTFTYNGPALVKSIVTQSGEADFTYGSNYSSYLNSSTPPPLTSITIKQFNPITNSNSNVLQTYNFAYTDLMIGIYSWQSSQTNPAMWWDYYRRLLSSITVSGNTVATAGPFTLYNLKYYQGLNFSDRASVQFWDYWGFQNYTNLDYYEIDNSDAAFFLAPDTHRTPASYTPTGGSVAIPMAANFALQELDELGGASTIFNYQQNYYYNGSANVAAAGTRIGSIVRKLPTGETLTTNYNYNDANGNSTGQIWSDLYRHVYMYLTPTCCSVSTIALSQSPYGIADANGVMLGYSSVTTTDPNGGYTTSTFNNFSNYPDVNPVLSFWSFQNVSATYGSAYVSEQLSDFSYRRGTLSSQTAFTAGGNMVSQDVNTYGSVDQGAPPPTATAVGIQDMTWYTTVPVYYGVNIYHSNIEDWRLTETVHKDFDQLNTSAYLQTVTNYSYATDNRQIRSVTTLDSKGQTHQVTYYYSDDTGIPFTTSTEQQTLPAMAAPAVNATGLLVHKIDSRNNVIHQWHRTYSPFQAQAGTNYYLTASTNYTGTSPLIQQFYNYNLITSQLISTNLTGGMASSAVFGYNSAYPIVTIQNAANTAGFTAQQITQGGNLTIVPNTWSSISSPPFTLVNAGTINVTMALGAWFSGGATATVNVSLTGASTVTLTTTNNAVNFTNMPPGTYVLTVTPETNTTTIAFPVGYTYPTYTLNPSGSTECFFEGFEQNTAATAGTAHSGNYYYNGNYTVAYTPPTSRQYLIQWWNLSGGQWVFNQMPYTANMMLSGPVDDVRVFPSDALMTTYTYSPMLGRTSETDPAGRTKKYVYDGLGRLQQIIDQDGNILKQNDYEYQVGLSQ